MHYAEYQCSMPPVAALLLNFVPCVYRKMFYAVLPTLATLSSKCVPIVNIWPGKMHSRLNISGRVRLIRCVRHVAMPYEIGRE